jgi:hypothetical protein
MELLWFEQRTPRDERPQLLPKIATNVTSVAVQSESDLGLSSPAYLIDVSQQIGRVFINAKGPSLPQFV